MLLSFLKPCSSKFMFWMETNVVFLLNTFWHWMKCHWSVTGTIHMCNIGCTSMKGLSWNFPLSLLRGVGNPIGKGQGDAMRIIHLGIQYLLSFMTHAVMQLATLLHRISTWHINNKAPVKRDWIGSFPHYFHTTTHTKTRPEPNSTNQALQLVSTKVETWFPNISQWAKSRILLGTLEEWLIGFHCFSCWIFDIPTPFLTSFQLPA